MINKFGRELVEKREIINHDSRDMKNMVFKGILPSGGELWLNSLVDWADLVVSEGLLNLTFCRDFPEGEEFYRELHQKNRPGKPLFNIYCSSYAKDRNLHKNPIHTDMLFASHSANLRFILNVVLNSEEENLELCRTS